MLPEVDLAPDTAFSRLGRVKFVLEDEGFGEHCNGIIPRVWSTREYYSHLFCFLHQSWHLNLVVEFI